MLDVPRRWERFDIRVKKLAQMCMFLRMHACFFKVSGMLLSFKYMPVCPACAHPH